MKRKYLKGITTASSKWFRLVRDLQSQALENIYANVGDEWPPIKEMKLELPPHTSIVRIVHIPTSTVWFYGTQDAYYYYCTREQGEGDLMQPTIYPTNNGKLWPWTLRKPRPLTILGKGVFGLITLHLSLADAIHLVSTCKVSWRWWKEGGLENEMEKRIQQQVSLSSKELTRCYNLLSVACDRSKPWKLSRSHWSVEDWELILLLTLLPAKIPRSKLFVTNNVLHENGYTVTFKTEPVVERLFIYTSSKQAKTIIIEWGDDGYWTDRVTGRAGSLLPSALFGRAHNLCEKILFGCEQTSHYQPRQYLHRLSEYKKLIS